MQKSFLLFGRCAIIVVGDKKKQTPRNEIKMTKQKQLKLNRLNTIRTMAMELQTIRVIAAELELTTERVRQLARDAGIKIYKPNEIKEIKFAKTFAALVCREDIAPADMTGKYYISRDGEEFYKINYKEHSLRKLVITPPSTKYGYPRVSYHSKTEYIHRIVYAAFIAPIPAGMTIDHIDGNHCNNEVSNLRILSQQENSRQGLIRTLAKYGVDKLIDLKEDNND